MLNKNYVWTFEYRKKSWWRRWLTKEKYEWVLVGGDSVTAPLPQVIGYMRFYSDEQDSTAQVFAEGTTIIHKK